MADIRINALATTAASTASDDFIAVDGSANGTRKLNAYSPTFGGNLTVSGTSIAVGTALTTGRQSILGGTWIPNAAASAVGVELNSAITPNANQAGIGLYVNPSFTEASSGTHSIIAGTYLGSFAVTDAAGATTEASTLYVAGAPTGAGTNKYALHVAGGNSLLDGNLTVSGTGTSSVAGNLGIGTTNPNAKAAINGTADTGPTTNSNGILKVGDQTQTNGLIVGLYNSGTYGVYLQASDIRSGGGTPNYPIIVNPNGGNVLLGTTTDGGQKLQVNGEIYCKSDTGTNITVNDPTYSHPVIVLQEAGSTKGAIETNSGTLYLSTTTAGKSLILRSGAYGTALTLDSSQNATFAGTSVTVDGASTGSTLTLKRASNANGAIISYKTTTTSKWYHGLRGLVDDNWYLQNDVAGNTALFFDASTSNATFAGSIAIGNTVNTVSPTSPNRTITMVIGGTTYYIHAKTTND